MVPACTQVPSSNELFDTSEAVAAANYIRRGNARGLKKMIAEGLDVNLRGRGGADLSKWSLVWGSPACLEALLEGNARTDHVPAGKYTGKVEQTLLMPVMELAASWNDPRYLSLLLRHGGDPDALDVYGSETIINQAIMHSQIDNVRLLIEAGADVNARHRGSLETPLSRAVAVKKYEIAYYLLEQGADPTLEDQWGYTVADSIKTFKDRGVGRDMYDWYVKVVERLGLDLEAVTVE